jgi:uncharacterized protein YbaA (DUF1428 family)
MAKYVDGFVLVIPRKKVAAYRKMAAAAGKVWRKCGALDYKECMGDDMHPNMGGMQTPTFPKMIKARKGETVWFSYIVFKSRKHRDQVNAKVMKDPFMNPPKDKQKKMMQEMPFDMKRMAYGGFKVIVDR